MKKAVILGLISFLMLLVISGCGSKETRDFNIENHNWVFSNMVDSKSGTIYACGATVSEQYPDVQIIEMTCIADGSKMVVADSNGNKWDFDYSISGKDTSSLIYELVYSNGTETIKGMAVSSITEYEKGKYEYTLVVDMDDYAVYFYERIEE